MKKVQIMVQDMEISTWQLFDQRGRKHVNILPYDNQSVAVLANDRKEFDAESHHSITYETDIDTLTEIDVLYIYDLPNNLNLLKEVIQKTKPKSIHACYTIGDSAYLTFPQREEFKWYYALIRKQKSLDLKRELQNLMRAKNWSKERIIFMSKVFFELGFVTINNGIVSVTPNPKKRDLTESMLYSQHINYVNVEKTLYYSNYEELKDWLEDCITKEEVIHGL